MEKIQDKYIKWTLKTDKTTPRHILHEETRRWKLAIQFRKRAMKYEQKMIESERGTMCREGIKSMMKTGTQSETEKARRRFYEDKGWAVLEINRRLENGETIWTRLTERAKDIEKQRRREEINESKFAKEIQRIILAEDLPGYLGGTTHRNQKELQTMARLDWGAKIRARDTGAKRKKGGAGYVSGKQKRWSI